MERPILKNLVKFQQIQGIEMQSQESKSQSRNKSCFNNTNTNSKIMIFSLLISISKTDPRLWMLISVRALCRQQSVANQNRYITTWTQRTGVLLQKLAHLWIVKVDLFLQALCWKLCSRLVLKWLSYQKKRVQRRTTERSKWEFN